MRLPDPGRYHVSVESSAPEADILRVLDEGDNLLLALLAFASFCFAASGIYIWNDLLDIEADRRHPTKRNRPIASGELSVGAARVAGVAFPIIALALAAATGRWQRIWA